MKAISNLRLCKPISLVRVYKNKQLERTVSNTVTINGLDEIMKSTSNPLVDGNGGRLHTVKLGYGTTPITFETNEPTDLITATGLTTTATVIYKTELGTRYGYANLFYRFSDPVTSVNPLRQIMIVQPELPGNVMFGLTLEQPIDISNPSIIDIVYTIKFPVLSEFKALATSDILGSSYTALGRFGEEGWNRLKYDWPASTSLDNDVSTALSQFYVNDNLLPIGSGRYRSDRQREGYRYIQRIYTRILGTPPGALTINKFEYGAVMPDENSYTIRLNLSPGLVKASNEVFDMETLIIVEWDEPDFGVIPEVYASLFPKILFTL